MKTLTEIEYQRIKKQVQEARASFERARGAWQEIMSRLKEEFQVETMEEAMHLLEEMEAEEKEAAEKVNQAYEAFRKKWNA